jgi:hypothetical protein
MWCVVRKGLINIVRAGLFVIFFLLGFGQLSDIPIPPDDPTGRLSYDLIYVVAGGSLLAMWMRVLFAEPQSPLRRILLSGLYSALFSVVPRLAISTKFIIDHDLGFDPGGVTWLFILAISSTIRGMLSAMLYIGIKWAIGAARRLMNRNPA